MARVRKTVQLASFAAHLQDARVFVGRLMVKLSETACWISEIGKRRATVVKALFSIKPIFARLILSGDKKCEYRRKLPMRPISGITIYATSPVSRVVGEAKVEAVLFLEKETLWRQTCSYGGISRDEFESYFCDVEMAGAILLSNPVAYEHPLSIEEMGVVRPPQSFCYLGGKDE